MKRLVAGMTASLAELILPTRIGWKPFSWQKPGWVCQKVLYHTFSLWLFTADGQAVGFLNLRLLLNDHLLQEGGHIGYSIRPSARGKGLAKEQLRQGLQVAKSKNIKRALVTCDRDNAASRGVILANGGVLEDIRGGKERYWIDID